MTYLIDGRALQDRSALRGIGSYVRGLLSGYAELGAASDMSLLLKRGPVPTEVAAMGIDIAPVRLLQTKRRIQPLADPLLVAAAIRRSHARLYHGVDYGQPLQSPVPVVITVHDLIPFVFPHRYPWMRRERIVALRLLKRADALIADSHSTARDLVRIAGADGDRIHVIPLGVGPQFRRADDEGIAAVRKQYGLDRPYLLAVAAFDPRKRIDLLVDVARAVRRDHDVMLVIAGGQGNFGPRVEAAVTEAGLREHTVIAGHVDEPTLIRLLSGAACMPFTSEYEGFGLPPLEALACGTPVAVFDNSSLREVAGDAAMVITDGDAAAMAARISTLLGDPAAASAAGQRGIEWAARFTWKETAMSTLGVYERLLR